MRFLVDRCAGRRLAEALRGERHDVAEVRSLGPDPGDRALLALAVEQGRVLVTLDTDFAALVVVEGRSHRGLLRLPDVPSRRRIELTRQVLAKHAGDRRGRRRRDGEGIPREGVPAVTDAAPRQGSTGRGEAPGASRELVRGRRKRPFRKGLDGSGGHLFS